MPRRSRCLAALSAAAVVGSLVLAPASTAEPIPDPAPDYCREQCHHILPPGQNGNATFAELVAHMLLGTRPPHSDDQLAKYDRLAGGYRELTTGTIDDFFNDNSFGVRPDDVERTYRPREDVTIVRDKTAGIPHIYGTTRSGTAYGAGYATAEDKLFLMDAMRRAGRGEVTPFAGGAPANRQLEQQFFTVSPYTEQELQQQIDTVARYGERGRQALEDAKSYVDGINEYIEKSYNGRYFPGEYVATGHVDPITNAGRIEQFRLTDLVVLASLVGAQFGGGGGNEVQNAVARMSLHERFGPERGEQIWAAFRVENDPEAISTIHDGQSFPYGGTPADPRGVVLPDPGSVSAQQLIFDPTGSAVEAAEPATRAESSNPPPATDDPVESLRGIFDDGVVPGGMGQARGMSNALVVSGAHTESGHPVAVFGPQTGYFSPQLLTLQELQGPGISSKGASFAGLSFYTLLGRGQDYAWSATTASQDMIDSYAVELCEPDGRPATKDSNFYRFRGECLAMQTVERKNAWQPNLGDDTPQGSYRLVSFRTRYGPVTHRATVDGQPVAFARARSTFLHEVDSIIGFQKFNDPGAITSAADFQRAAHDINYTFNWFYADATDTAYFNSGANVVRKPDVDPSMPIAGDPDFEWQGWNPADNTAAYAPFHEHPNSINQDYYISWNNKQAPGTAGDKAEKGAVQRGDLLDRRVAEHIASGGKFSRVTLTQAMADAGVTDLRAERVLPDLLRLIDSQPVTDPETAALVDRLRAWLVDGGKRVETSPGSEEYAHAEAIELLDAWWPRLVRGEFEPAVGADAYRAMTDMMQINESPSGWQNGEPGLHVGQGHQGSAFQFGWFGQVSKDIRAVLGEPVPGGFGEPLCGGGDAGACRQMLLDTLRQAAETPATDTYPGDADCKPGDQWCADAILQTKIGGISQQKINWQNRPTYQQVVEFPTHR
ncbi:penicillin acylase family protein [Saccharopolyspora elongata]|uniref:Penicillin acylase family protein n=1 Tax=Saccharopolyspora elongata TaxID=2530387 RepID=A0A4R4ZDI7_9PSEU|nr:penicillin acylase family protein [Saccharopolyspora elongata]TDD54402.1 penicillin acylase family protein [Saccharopolyspora elongata]